MKTDFYTPQGTSAGTLELPSAVFDVAYNGDLVHQVVTGLRANMRASTAHVKDRSEVSGTGKKPWRQKGTGNARHGSRRSPIWRTGGIAHGPTSEKDYSQKINKKMKNKALAVMLSQKLRDEQILFVDTLSFDAIKTQEADAILQKLESVKGFETINTRTKANNILLVLPERNDVLEKSFRNIPHVTIVTGRALNALDCARYRYIIIASAQENVELLANRITQ